MTQVLHLSSRWNKFLVSLFMSIQSFVFISGRISPQDFEMFSISPQQAYSFFCRFFPTTPFDPSPKDAFSSSFEVEYVVFSFVLLIPFLHLFRRHCVVARFTHHVKLWRSCSFHAYPFNRSVVSSFQVSSHLVKIMFNSFHLQSECCPNYIILIPSLSYFNRSVVSIIPLLTRVSSKCFHFAKFIFLPSISNWRVVVIDPYRSLYISFQPECLHVLLVHCSRHS